MVSSRFRDAERAGLTEPGPFGVSGRGQLAELICWISAMMVLTASMAALSVVKEPMFQSSEVIRWMWPNATDR